MNNFDLIKTIVARHRYRQSLPNPHWDDLGGLIWPRMIHTPSGRKIFFDKQILVATADLADSLQGDSHSVDSEEWLEWVQESVACALDRSDANANLDDTARQILDSVKETLDQHEKEKGQFEFAFGCELFSEISPHPFSIGPVRFETRQDWLERKFTEGAISDAMRHHILRTWEGDTPREPVSSADRHQENTILGLTNDASFICSVRTDGMTQKFGRSRALTTARLALASIALCWRPASEALKNMNLTEDRVVRILHEITFQGGKITTLAGRKSHVPGGETLPADEWNRLQGDFADHFKLVGSLLDSIADITTPPGRPKTTHALIHALLWFHQGCWENEQVMAVISFAAALDCLALGKSHKGIKKLVAARVGVEADKALWARGSQTAGEAIEEIYDYARNATIHGRKGHGKKPDSTPFRDWGPVRLRAGTLAHSCLLECIDWAAKHPQSDDPAGWLKK